MDVFQRATHRILRETSPADLEKVAIAARQLEYIRWAVETRDRFKNSLLLADDLD
jgi:hypothetical protein